MKKLLIFAALTAASLSQPAVSRPVEPRSAPVEYRDLNLQSREGVRTLDRAPQAPFEGPDALPGLEVEILIFDRG